MQRGVESDGQPLYPAFPYTSYARMTAGDIADLHAYLMTLPLREASTAQRSRIPLQHRRGVGLWQRVFLDPGAGRRAAGPTRPRRSNAGSISSRGRAIAANATRRGPSALGGLDHSRWLAGGPAPDGDGNIPDITPGGETADWSEADLATYFETGFTPDFDSVGGSMVAVQNNLAKLPPEDRAAIASLSEGDPRYRISGEGN